MEKTIKIDGRDVTFKSTGGVLYRYKNQFGREYLADLISLQEFMDSKKLKKVKAPDGKISFADDYDFTKLNLQIAYDLAWTFAKTADSTIPDPQTWLDSFNVFPIMEIFPRLTEMFAMSAATEDNLKN